MTHRHVASPLPSARPLRLPISMLRPHGRADPRPARSASASRIGTQMRALRMAAGLSASKLAQRSGVSNSMLSRIERGLVSPSVETLDRIASGLEVPTSRFFGDQPSRMDFSYVPAGRGLVVDRIGTVGEYRYELLGHLLSGNLFVEPYLVTLLPGAKPYVTFQHPGLKFLHLLSGQVTYRYGDRILTLGQGDSLLFEAAVLHGIEVIGTQPVTYLSIVFTLRD